MCVCCAIPNVTFTYKVIYHMILDSGATMYMTFGVSIFSSFTQFPIISTHTVLLEYGTIYLYVTCISTIGITIGSRLHTRLRDIILVPGLYATPYPIEHRATYSDYLLHTGGLQSRSNRSPTFPSVQPQRAPHRDGYHK